MCKFTQALFNCNHTALYTEPMHTDVCHEALNFNIRQGRTIVPAPCFPLPSDVHEHDRIAATYRIFTVCHDCQYTEADMARVYNLKEYVEQCIGIGRRIIEMWESDAQYQYIMQIIPHEWLHKLFSVWGREKFDGLFMGEFALMEKCLEYLEEAVDLDDACFEFPRDEFLREMDGLERIAERAKMKLRCCVEIVELVNQGDVLGSAMEEVGDRLQGLVCGNSEDADEIESVDELEEGEILDDDISETFEVSDPEQYHSWASRSEREYVNPDFDRWLKETYGQWNNARRSYLVHDNKRKSLIERRGPMKLTIEIPTKRKANLPEVEVKAIVSTSSSEDEPWSCSGSV